MGFFSRIVKTLIVQRYFDLPVLLFLILKCYCSENTLSLQRYEKKKC